LSENALITYQSKIAVDESDFQHREVVFGRLLEACEDAPAFLQPADESFDDVAVAICLSVKLHGSGIPILVALGRNDRCDARSEKILIDPVGAEALVACQPHGAERLLNLFPCDGNSLQQGFKSLGFMGLSSGEVDVEGVAMAITEQMDLRRKSAPRTA